MPCSTPSRPGPPRLRWRDDNMRGETCEAVRECEGAAARMRGRRRLSGTSWWSGDLTTTVSRCTPDVQRPTPVNSKGAQADRAWRVSGGFGGVSCTRDRRRHGRVGQSDLQRDGTPRRRHAHQVHDGDLRRPRPGAITHGGSARQGALDDEPVRSDAGPDRRSTALPRSTHRGPGACPLDRHPLGHQTGPQTIGLPGR